MLVLDQYCVGVGPVLCWCWTSTVLVLDQYCVGVGPVLSGLKWSGSNEISYLKPGGLQSILFQGASSTHKYLAFILTI